MSNSTTNLDLIPTSSANKEAVGNGLFDAASPAAIWGRRASTTTGLTWGYYGGTYMVGATANAVANGTLTLTASTTNYVYADNVTGAVSANTTGFPAGKIPLYSIVTGTSTVTSYTDYRSYQPSSIPPNTALSQLTDVNVTEGSAIDKDMLRWDNTSGKWIADARAYDMAVNFVGVTTNGEKMRIKMVRAVTFPASLTGSSADAGTAATASTTFTLLQNGSSIGTIVFGAGSSSGTITFASPVTFAAGDTFQISAPATADATLADIAFTFKGTY